MFVDNVLIILIIILANYRIHLNLHGSLPCKDGLWPVIASYQAGRLHLLWPHTGFETNHLSEP